MSVGRGNVSNMRSIMAMLDDLDKVVGELAGADLEAVDAVRALSSG